jgi:c-di-GMP-binding flagellar brake protein YcgR
MQVKEKRATKRFMLKRSISYLDMGEIGRYPEEVSCNIELVDISDGGMKIRVEGLFPIEGDIVQMRIPIDGILVTLPVFAQIKWAKKVQSKLYNVGLQFLF